MSYEVNDQGQRLYYCLTCLDMGWVHPRKPDGSIDYAHVKRCDCKVPVEKQQEFPIEHAEKPSRRKR
jgi:hypothetical protein